MANCELRPIGVIDSDIRARPLISLERLDLSLACARRRLEMRCDLIVLHRVSEVLLVFGASGGQGCHGRLSGAIVKHLYELLFQGEFLGK